MNSTKWPCWFLFFLSVSNKTPHKRLLNTLVKITLLDTNKIIYSATYPSKSKNLFLLKRWGKLFLDFSSFDKGGFFLAGSRGIWTWAPGLILSICIETVIPNVILSRQPNNAILYVYLALKTGWKIYYMLGLKAEKRHFFKGTLNEKKIKGFLTWGPARLYLLVNQPYRCTDRTRLPTLFRACFKERG